MVFMALTHDFLLYQRFLTHKCRSLKFLRLEVGMLWSTVAKVQSVLRTWQVQKFSGILRFSISISHNIHQGASLLLKRKPSKAWGLVTLEQHLSFAMGFFHISGWRGGSRWIKFWDVKNLYSHSVATNTPGNAPHLVNQMTIDVDEACSISLARETKRFGIVPLSDMSPVTMPLNENEIVCSCVHL